jgi:hypothetical protein
MPTDGSELLEELMRFRPDGMTANAWAVKAGVSRTIWSDLRRHGNPSRRTLSRLLEAAGSSLAEFEALRIGTDSAKAAAAAALADPSRAWGSAPAAPLLLFPTVQRGFWGACSFGIPLLSVDREKVIDRLPRPTSLGSDTTAYALSVPIESMWPRFRLGRRVAVSAAATVQSSDDVLVTLAHGGGALLAELRSRSAESLGLRQFTPPTEFEVPASEVEAVHKVIGELL